MARSAASVGRPGVRRPEPSYFFADDWEQIVDAIREASSIGKNRRCRAVTVVTPEHAVDSQWPAFLDSVDKKAQMIRTQFEVWAVEAAAAVGRQ